MTPGALDFICYAGATFRATVAWIEDDAADDEWVDLTGYTALMEVRNAAGTLLTSLSTEDGGAVVGVDGRLTLEVDDDETRTFVAGAYLYDLLLRDSDGFVTPVIKGKFTVRALVTRSEPEGDTTP